MTKTSLS